MSGNVYRGESEVTIPAEFLEAVGKKDIVLPVRFTHSSYVELERLTGVKHFARLQDFNEMLSEEFIAFALYAGTRKTKPGVTLKQINEWLDAVPPSKLVQVFKDVQTAFTISLRGPVEGEAAKRGEIETRLQKVNPKCFDKILELLNDPIFDKPKDGADEDGPLDPATMTKRQSLKAGVNGSPPA